MAFRPHCAVPPSRVQLHRGPRRWGHEQWLETRKVPVFLLMLRPLFKFGTNCACSLVMMWAGLSPTCQHVPRRFRKCSLASVVARASGLLGRLYLSHVVGKYRASLKITGDISSQVWFEFFWCPLVAHLPHDRAGLGKQGKRKKSQSSRRPWHLWSVCLVCSCFSP